MIQTETPVGVEPTKTGLQPVAWPSGSSVIRGPCQDSNLVPRLNKAVCDLHTPWTRIFCKTPVVDFRFAFRSEFLQVMSGTGGRSSASGDASSVSTFTYGQRRRV